MSESEHVGGSHPNCDGNTFMVDVFGYLLVKYNPGLILDLGCGYGHVLQWFSQFPLNLVGVDGDKEAIEKSVFAGTKVLHDFTKGPYVHGTPFDLVWCAEVLEHIEEKYLPNVAPCFQASRYVVITHAEPHQFGHHHVNCKPDSYWIGKFSEWGLKHNESETAILRRTDRWHASWGRRTLMFFERP